MRSCFILGSGRSGTSLMCGLLAKAGYFVGEKIIPPDDANPKGYFECLKINAINEDILSQYIPNRWKGVMGDIFTPARTVYGQRWLTGLDRKIKFSMQQGINKRIDFFLSHSSFCFKDPRFSYTLPVWQNRLQNQKEVIYICVFRHPEEVIGSMVKEAVRDSAIRRIKLRFGQPEAEAVWSSMYRNILLFFDSVQQEKDRWFFISYEQMLKNINELSLLENKLGVKLDRQFVDQDLNRSKKKDCILKDNSLNYLYDRMQQLSHTK